MSWRPEPTWDAWLAELERDDPTIVPFVLRFIKDGPRKPVVVECRCCGAELTPGQRRFCGERCRNLFTDGGRAWYAQGVAHGKPGL